MSTIDKTKLKERVQNMEQELAAMKAELDKAEAETEGNEFMRVPEVSTDNGHVIKQHNCSGEFTNDMVEVCEDETWLPTYATAEIAQKTAEAFEIWREWTSCKGVVALEADVPQWIADSGCISGCWEMRGNKISTLSPCFDTHENCEASIKKIGVDRIQKMRNYFHFKFD